MRHLLDGHLEQRLAPAADGFDLIGRQSVLRAGAQAESRVQVSAHEIVLELGGFVERVQDGFAVGQPRRCDGFGHRSSQGVSARSSHTFVRVEQAPRPM
jgi:hypothetical protein